MKQIFTILISLLFLANACSPSQGKTDEKAGKMMLKEETNLVETLVLKKTEFEKEIISNGKIYALQKSDLIFTVPGKVKSLNVVNGSKLSKGDIVASLEDFDFISRLEKTKHSVEKAKLDTENILIGQGYDGKDTLNIPKDVLRIAKLKSGLFDALIDFKRAQHEYQASSLRAPFSGVVANLSGRLHNNVELGKTFCILMNQEQFELEFSVLESEVFQLSVGQQVKIQPFAFNKGEYKGQITQINPRVDENGLVLIKATVKNKDGKLIEGMNIRVVMLQKLNNQLVVPKSALLLRQNKQVVFTYKDGKALWNYVKTGQENSLFYTIVDGLKQDDEVIVKGSLNLAHESSVEVKN